MILKIFSTDNIYEAAGIRDFTLAPKKEITGIQFQILLSQLLLDSNIPELQNFVLQIYLMIITFSNGKKKIHLHLTLVRI